MSSIEGSHIRAIAFYLPQFHPIPENDQWWGKGFTEWTNVAKGVPLFPGHYQPHIPADLGFYDLRLPQVRRAQADLAREYGIYGFCYYHYWFNGKRLLHEPLDDLLVSGQPEFPFCICWANENWTRAWDGHEKHVLIRQTYSDEDDRQHIRWLIETVKDKRYVRVNDKPLILIYRASSLPAAARTTEIWREEARRGGVGELYLCRVESFREDRSDPTELGFDAAVEFQPDWEQLGQKLRGRSYQGLRVYDYAETVDRMLRKPAPAYRRIPCVTPSWDNSPRRKSNPVILADASPRLYHKWLSGIVRRLSGGDDADENLVFINAWNEWGEGNHLEPDLRHGRAYLEATKRAIMGLGESEEEAPIPERPRPAEDGPSRRSLPTRLRRGLEYGLEALLQELARKE